MPFKMRAFRDTHFSCFPLYQFHGKFQQLLQKNQAHEKLEGFCVLCELLTEYLADGIIMSQFDVARASGPRSPTLPEASNCFFSAFYWEAGVSLKTTVETHCQH